MSDKKKNVKRPLRTLAARDLMKPTGGAPAGAASIPDGALGFLPSHPVLGLVPTRHHHHHPHRPVLGFVPSGPKGPILGFLPSKE